MPYSTHGETRKAYMGIDPGASGGLALIDGCEIEAVAMPATERDIWLWVSAEHVDFAVIEQNTGYVGGEGNPGSAMFKFGRSAGLLTMALVAAGVPYEEITPGQWQKKLGIPPRKKGEAKGAFKNRLKAEAQRLFPRIPVTLKTADALLLAEYARRKAEGKL